MHRANKTFSTVLHAFEDLGSTSYNEVNDPGTGRNVANCGSVPVIILAGSIPTVDFGGVERMTNLLVTWLLSAVSLLIVGYVVKGFDISGFGSALIAAVVIGLVNGTIGFFLKVVAFPLTILTLGLFWWVINALMLKVAAALVSGFKINGFLPALVGALALSLVNLLLRTFLQV
jgi:putative membrane protein